ncbi:TPA: hypothetical protein ACLIVI_005416 [Bacillus pacificus]
MNIALEKKLYAVKTAVEFLTEEDILRSAYSVYQPVNGETETMGIVLFSFGKLQLIGLNMPNENSSAVEVFRIDSGLPLREQVKIRKETLEKINQYNGETKEELEAYIIENEAKSINLEEIKQNIITYFKDHYEEIQKAIF